MEQFQLLNQEILCSEIVPVHPYSHGSLSIGGHPQMMFPSAMVPARTGNIPTIYKVGVPTTQPPLQNMLPSVSCFSCCCYYII